MNRAQFGRTDLSVSNLGLGTSGIGFRDTDIRAVDAILGVALDVGINVIDTAAMYMDAESKIGRVLGRRRDQFYLFTKCGLAPPPYRDIVHRGLRKARGLWRRVSGALPIEWHPRTLAWNIDESLRRMRTDRVDLMQLHGCPESIGAKDEVLGTLLRARDAGKVRYIGYSGDCDGALWAIRSGKFNALQTSVNIADQSAIDGTVSFALQQGFGLIAKRAIANALWFAGERPRDPTEAAYWNRLRTLDYDFTKTNTSIATALRFTLSTGVHVALVGTTNPHHLRASAEAVSSASHLEVSDFETIRARWIGISTPAWIGQT
jgi:aryl-alcohol dehydrogenase-like predicted oxidoreductase